ncbi:MAG: hypothetical protein WC376_02755 [Candidatus Nanoarchaeia archaeon]|jgi:uncharacterized membrane protein
MAKSNSKKVEKKEVVKTSDVESGKTLAALSYLWIVGVILFFTEKNNKFIIFHAKQATALFVIETVLMLIPILGMLSIIPGIAAIYGFIMALQGSETKIPLANELGEKIAELITPKK